MELERARSKIGMFWWVRNTELESDVWVGLEGESMGKGHSFCMDGSIFIRTTSDSGSTTADPTYTPPHTTL